MKPRQQELLKKIIITYIKTGEPVGSKSLAAEGDFELSSATIRNEMSELEQAGYIYQPYTSAGRVPTEDGYLFYVENYVLDELPSEVKLSSAVKSKIDRFLEKGEAADLKNLAKTLAELSEALIILAFDEDHVYYTGLSYLYSQPEFIAQAAVTTVSQVLDHCEKVLPKIFDLMNEERKILIGRENPFGSACSFLSAKIGDGLIGILGPMRMDYENNLKLINYIDQRI